MAARVFRAARLALLVALFCVLAKALPAQKPATEDAINKALETSVKDLTFAEIPLEDVVDRLKEMYRIRIVMDRRVMEDSSVGTDRLFTFKASNIRLRAALNLILRQHELGWFVYEEFLVITTREDANQQFVSKVYPVHELIRDKQREGTPDDFDELITLVKSTIEPQSWPPVDPKAANKQAAPVAGIAASRATDTIVVWHNRQVHEQIEELLRGLIAAKQARTNATTSK